MARRPRARQERRGRARHPLRPIVLLPVRVGPLAGGAAPREPAKPRPRARRARVGRQTHGATMMQAMALTAAPDAQAIEQYRTELTGYCYRMLGSSFEAEDAVQETMLRAWRALDRFEGRSAF